jgi:hypothetical protein
MSILNLRGSGWWDVEVSHDHPFHVIGLVLRQESNNAN